MNLLKSLSAFIGMLHDRSKFDEFVEPGKEISGSPGFSEKRTKYSRRTADDVYRCDHCTRASKLLIWHCLHLFMSLFKVVTIRGGDMVTCHYLIFPWNYSSHNLRRACTPTSRYSHFPIYTIPYILTSFQLPHFPHVDPNLHTAITNHFLFLINA